MKLEARELDLASYKELLLDNLLWFDKICTENNLQYSLAYGTLIGAIRHQGFIPWDDDVDVYMPRSDYEKLLKLDFHDSRYSVLSYKNTKDYYYAFAKTCDHKYLLHEKYRIEKYIGVYVDIFPVDRFDFSKKDEFTAKSSIIVRRTDRVAYTFKNNALKNVAKAIIRLDKTYMKKNLRDYDEYLNDVVTKSAISAGTIGSGDFYFKNLYDIDLFGKGTIPCEFEGRSLQMIPEYDKVLSQCYGDYMKLPPESERKPHHVFEVYEVIE